jgi:hypothetical protein
VVREEEVVVYGEMETTGEKVVVRDWGKQRESRVKTVGRVMYVVDAFQAQLRGDVLLNERFK